MRTPPPERESETTKMDRKDGGSGNPGITKNVSTITASNSTITIFTKSATTKSRYGGFIGGNTR